MTEKLQQSFDIACLLLGIAALKHLLEQNGGVSQNVLLPSHALLLPEMPTTLSVPNTITCFLQGRRPDLREEGPLPSGLGLLTLFWDSQHLS